MKLTWQHFPPEEDSPEFWSAKLGPLPIHLEVIRTKTRGWSYGLSDGSPRNLFRGTVVYDDLEAAKRQSVAHASSYLTRLAGDLMTVALAAVRP